MHELSVASSIIEIILDEVRRKNLGRVNEVGLKIGVLSGIMPDSLEFGFDALKMETPLAQTRLVIEQVPLQGMCTDCGEAFSVQDLVFQCPGCGSSGINVSRGQELDIAYLDVED